MGKQVWQNENWEGLVRMGNSWLTAGSRSWRQQERILRSQRRELAVSASCGAADVTFPSSLSGPGRSRAFLSTRVSSATKGTSEVTDVWTGKLRDGRAGLLKASSIFGVCKERLGVRHEGLRFGALT